MTIIVRICDHCDNVLRGGKFVSYRVGNGPDLDICESCQEKPFRMVEPSAKGRAVAETVRLALGAN